MSTVNLGPATYTTYASVDEADTYLMADVERAPAWANRTPAQKAMGLITATRLLGRLAWGAGVAPDPTGTFDPRVKEAIIVLAADILTKPAIGSSPGTSTTVRRAKAGSAEVEFFSSAQDGKPLPEAAWGILTSMPSLLGGGIIQAGDALWGYAGGTDQCTRFEPTDFGLTEPFR